MLRPTLVGVVFATLFVLVGCTKESTPSLPSTPEGTVETVAKAIADKKPGIVWVALPPSYQQDITGFVRTFAEKMDKEVYDKTFVVLGKAIKVLKDKKDFILGHPMLQGGQVNMAEAKANWDSVVGLLETLTESEINSIDSLKTLNIGEYVATTGAKLMSQAADLSKLTPEDEMGQGLDKLAKLKIEVLSSDGDNAKLRLTLADEPPEDVELVKVEGKWVPKDLADEWALGMEKLREGLDEMKMGERKAQMMMMLGGVEGAMDSLLAAKTQEEFNQAFMQTMGQVMGALMGAGGDAPPFGK